MTRLIINQPPELVETPRYTPEQVLLLAVIERANRDLDVVCDPQNRRDAIRWFLCKSKCVYSFKYCGFYVNLTSCQIKELIRRAYEASKYEGERTREAIKLGYNPSLYHPTKEAKEKIQKERYQQSGQGWPSRTGAGRLAKRKRHSISGENRPAMW